MPLPNQRRRVSVCLTAIFLGAGLSGCATTGMSNFSLPIFNEKPEATGSTVSASDRSVYASERAYYEQYARNGHRHKGLQPPASVRRAGGDTRHDVIPNEARQQAAYDPRKVEPEPNWHAGGGDRLGSVKRTFRVQDGDTIDWIARVHNVSVRDLMRANRLREAQVYAGQTLIIPAEVSSDPFDNPPVQPVSALQSAEQTPVRERSAVSSGTGGLSEDGKIYTVEVGDTFYSIAKRNRVDPMRLADLNRIDDTTSIYPGQKLKLPSRW